MQAKVEIPDGWRLVQKEEILKAGDRFLSTHYMEWIESFVSVGQIAGRYQTVFIRKNEPAAQS